MVNRPQNLKSWTRFHNFTAYFWFWTFFEKEKSFLFSALSVHHENFGSKVHFSDYKPFLDVFLMFWGEPHKIPQKTLKMDLQMRKEIFDPKHERCTITAAKTKSFSFPKIRKNEKYAVKWQKRVHLFNLYSVGRSVNDGSVKIRFWSSKIDFSKMMFRSP